MYHCGTPPVLMHIGAGMYGAVIIDPPDLPTVDREFVMLQSDLYTAKGQVADLPALLAGQGDAVVFNGYVNQYQFRPIRVEPNERVRGPGPRRRSLGPELVPRHRHDLRHRLQGGRVPPPTRREPGRRPGPRPRTRPRRVRGVRRR